MTKDPIQTAIDALEKCRNYQIGDEIDRIVCPVIEQLRAHQSVQTRKTAEQHPDDLAVEILAIAMKEKLAQKRAEGKSGWNNVDKISGADLSAMLCDHVLKGDPVDVANFAMMIFCRGEKITSLGGHLYDGNNTDHDDLAIHMRPGDIISLPAGWTFQPRTGPRLVIMESPYAGDVTENMAYAHRCVLDCITRGESPYASHIMLTTALDDTVPAQRNTGIHTGLAWAARADAVVIYTDRGISPGMAEAIRHHQERGHRIEYRKLEG